MSKKYEDGIWLLKGTDGYTHVRFVKGGRGSITLIEGELQAPSSLDLLPLTPIRRIADLDGKPVVDEGVIEAIIGELPAGTINREVFEAILRKHLCPTKPAASGEDEGQYKTMYDHALECVDLAFQVRSNKPSPILPDFCKLGEDKFRAVVRLAESHKKLLNAISAAGFQVMQTSGDWSIHDVGEFAKRDEERTAEVVWKNIDLEVENAKLKARIAELEAEPATITATHRETATGDEWVFLPEDRKSSNRMGYRLRDGHTEWFSRSEISSYFTPLPEPAERPIVDLRKFGAFPCWEYLNGDEWTCYPSGSGHTRIRHRDGYAIWSAMSLNETLFTRTPPSPTLPPEQERLVGPIAAYFKVDESEARKALATCAGG